VIKLQKPVSFVIFYAPLDKYFKISAFSFGKEKFATVFDDITERKKDEDALRESEARFRSVLDNSRDVIYRLNQKTGHFYYGKGSMRGGSRQWVRGSKGQGSIRAAVYASRSGRGDEVPW
jgi:PAS domain-containing protein